MLLGLFLRWYLKEGFSSSSSSAFGFYPPFFVYTYIHTYCLHFGLSGLVSPSLQVQDLLHRTAFKMNSFVLSSILLSATVVSAQQGAYGQCKYLTLRHFIQHRLKADSTVLKVVASVGLELRLASRDTLAQLIAPITPNVSQVWVCVSLDLKHPIQQLISNFLSEQHRLHWPPAPYQLQEPVQLVLPLQHPPARQNSVSRHRRISDCAKSSQLNRHSSAGINISGFDFGCDTSVSRCWSILDFARISAYAAFSEGNLQCLRSLAADAFILRQRWVRNHSD